MALVVYDRVQQTGTPNTTVSFTLSGSVAGFQSFAVVGNGNTTYYAATDASGNWEVGLGTYSTTGPTLTRTTILSSSNSNLAVTFSGTCNIFVTYPSSTSVYEDTSGNVTPLGTITSGTWNGTTIGVAYGGTGVTTSSGANSVMLRDSNQNVAVNRINQTSTNTTAAGGVTALTVASSYIHTLNGTGGQTYTMPDATTLATGVAFIFNNLATGTLTLQNYAAGSIGTITAGGAGAVFLTNNGTAGGTWDLHAYLPEGVTFGTNAFNLGTAIVTGGTWQGGTIQSGYGGTGLTTFTAANNALYSTSASALAAGTLPVAAGGTGQSSYAVGDVLYASTTTALSKLADVATGNALISGGVGVAPSYGKIGLTTHVSGTLAVGNGGTGATTLTSNGVVYGNGTSAAGITAAGTTGQVLIATTSGAPSWGSVPTTAAVTSITFGSTGLTPATATTGAVTVAGTLVAANGGTGQSSYAVGDLLYASTTTALSKLADVATGNALISGGVGVAPSYGKIGLTTHVSGILPVANGGTNASTASITSFNNITGYTAAGATGTTSTNLVFSTNPTFAGLTNSGNIAFTGTGNRITGDMSNATIASRMAFQTSTANSPTSVSAIPSGTGTQADMFVFNNSDPTNAGLFLFRVTSTESSLRSAITGTGTYLPMSFFTNGSERLRITTAGGVSFGATGTAYGTSGQVLTSGGDTPPTWTTPSTVNNGTLTMNVSGTGLSGSQTFTANQSSAATFTVTSNATNANTASTIVARDASGNFSAGTITASLSGNASTATTATNATNVATTGASASASTFFLGFVSSNTSGNYGVTTTAALSFVPSTGALSATSHVSSSDETLKQNWGDLPTNFVSGLSQVKHGTFERIDNGNREVGVSAQSLEKILKEAVIKGEDGLLSVNYGGAALVAAIELAKEVVELRKEIELLKAK